MAVTRVNTATITASSSTASAYTTAVGVATAVGDLVVVTMTCNGTHAANGMVFSDAVNGTYTVLKEQDGSGSSSRWLQTFYKFTTGAMTTGTLLSATPYAASTASAFVVDIFRGTTGAISEPVVGASPAAGTTFAAPALAAAPPAGDLVLSLVFAAAGTLTKPAAFTQGSSTTTTTSAANGYVLSADGASTYGGTWSLSASNSNAAETVSFAQASGAAASRPHPPVLVRQAVNRAAVF